jgi:hypothetical protein
MRPQEISEYLRDHYSRHDNILLTLVSCALVLDKANQDHELPSEVGIVVETLNVLRESLSEDELLTVSMLLSEIDRLSDD